MTKYAPAIIALALLAILALQWLRWPPPARQSPTTEGPAVTASVAAPQPDLLARLESRETKESYASLTEHPLFRPDRKPEPPPEAEPAAPSGKDDAGLKLMDLTGVLITPSVVSAWVRDPSQPKLRSVYGSETISRAGRSARSWKTVSCWSDRVSEYALILRDYSQDAARGGAARHLTSGALHGHRLRAIPPKK